MALEKEKDNVFGFCPFMQLRCDELCMLFINDNDYKRDGLCSFKQIAYSLKSIDEVGINIRTNKLEV